MTTDTALLLNTFTACIAALLRFHAAAFIKRKGHKNQRDAVAAFPLMLMPDRTVTRTDKFTCLFLIIRASAENVNALNCPKFKLHFCISCTGLLEIRPVQND